jgi:hypothetical protein
MSVRRQTEGLLKLGKRGLHGLPVRHGGDRVRADERLDLRHLVQELPQVCRRRLAAARAGLHGIRHLHQ